MSTVLTASPIFRKLDYVALEDGSIWDREAVWQEVERVLRDERSRRRQQRRGRGRPATGPGSLAGVDLQDVQESWAKLEAERAKLEAEGKPHARWVSKAMVARDLYISRLTLWRVLGATHQCPWPPMGPA